jgi:hypothetical protein
VFEFGHSVAPAVSRAIVFCRTSAVSIATGSPAVSESVRCQRGSAWRHDRARVEPGGGNSHRHPPVRVVCGSWDALLTRRTLRAKVAGGPGGFLASTAPTTRAALGSNWAHSGAAWPPAPPSRCEHHTWRGCCSEAIPLPVSVVVAADVDLLFRRGGLSAVQALLRQRRGPRLRPGGGGRLGRGGRLSGSLTPH